MAAATPTITAPTLPPARAIASPTASRVPGEQHVRSGKRVEATRALKAAPDDRDAKGGGNGDDGRSRGERIVHAGQGYDDRRPDAHEGEDVAPEHDRASHALQEHPGALLVASLEPDGDFPRRRGLERERRNRRHDHYREERGEQRVFVRLEFRASEN